MVMTKFGYLWVRFWMRYAGLTPFGRVATWFAAWWVPPYYGRTYLSSMNRRGYVSPRATIHHDDLRLGSNVYIDDGVLIYQDKEGGPVELAEGVHLYRDTIIQTGAGGSVTIGPHTHLQPRCQLSAYKAPIHIGRQVEIAPNCAFYPYDHGFAPGEKISQQSLRTRGGITIEDDVWLGFGVIVLSGIRIGKGVVVGAGAVVTHEIPDGAIACGVPARIVKMRSDLA
jgi:acetyltransferase-like isoleucine patch superfamily enzyme